MVEEWMNRLIGQDMVLYDYSVNESTMNEMNGIVMNMTMKWREEMSKKNHQVMIEIKYDTNETILTSTGDRRVYVRIGHYWCVARTTVNITTAAGSSLSLLLFDDDECDGYRKKGEYDRAWQSSRMKWLNGIDRLEKIWYDILKTLMKMNSRVLVVESYPYGGLRVYDFPWWW